MGIEFNGWYFDIFKFIKYIWFNILDVICRIFGYSRGIFFCCSFYGFSFKNFIMSFFKCNGDERYLTDC